MINSDKLMHVLADYRKNFHRKDSERNNRTHWECEKYKWVAIKHFQKHWNIEAENFGAMFKEATSKCSNLLTSQNYFPRGMILDFAKADDEAVRNMFISLFDESISVVDRVNNFIQEAERIRSTYGADKWGSHYQNVNSISTYLWLRYPDKYYIYKYSECRQTAMTLESDFKVKKGAKSDALLDFIQFYDEIASAVSQDKDTVEMLREAMDESCYTDPEFRTLALDVGFYISRYYGQEKKKDDCAVEVIYWPSQEEYPLAITKEQWKKYILEVEFDHKACMAMLKAIVELGGEATCKKLSDIYGGTPQRYAGCTMNIGRRVKGYFNLPPCMDKDEERYFAMPFVGRSVIEEGTKYYSYRIRDELFEALKEIDLSEINPFVQDGEMEDDSSEMNYPKYSKEDFLSEVYMDEAQYETLSRLLKNKKNVILQGAPGVGKTFAAKRLAYSIMGVKDESRVEFIQFHQNYSYEDFVMGYKPEGEGFELKDGIFYRFCMKAISQQDKDFFFIIDEINRGNMSKIFGELLMLIERDYRGEKATLAYNGKSFSVPHNLYIIGMMNTADRSLAMIDYALRRRFSFFSMTPGFDTKGFKEYQTTINNTKLDSVIREVINLNKAIANDKSLGNGFCIGHSYFCGHNYSEDVSWVKEVIEYDIVPMLNEYWFDDQENVKKWSDILNGAFNG